MNPKMSPAQKAQLTQRIKRDAAKLGISPADFMRRLVAGQVPAHVVGASEIDDPPTYVTDNGAMLDIADRVTGEPDDFEMMLARRQQAMIDAGGDDFTRDAIMQKHAEASLAQDANFVRTNPRSSVNSVLGSTLSFGPDGQQQTLATWIADHDAETSLVTATLGQPVGSNLFSDSGAAIHATGTVQFGTRGLMVSVDFDIGAGVQFAVSGSQVVLLAKLDEITPRPNPFPQMQLSGMLSYGAITKGQKLTLTSPAFTVNNNALSTAVKVPAFAKDLTIYVAQANVSYAVDWVDSTGSVFAVASNTSGSAQPWTIPIPGNAYAVQLQNNVAAQTTFILVWGLAI